MYPKLFQVTLVILLVAVSVAVLAVIGSVIMSLLTPTTVAGTGGIHFVAFAISARQMGFMAVAASLIIAGFYIYVRRNRLRR